MKKELFKGTLSLIKFQFRQQRIKLFLWLFGLILVTLSVAASYPSIYKTEADKQGFALTMDNPAMTAMLGPGYELEEYLDSVGAIFAQEMLLFTIIAVIIMNILLVSKSTRSDEEDGRIELVRSLSIGRLAYISAAMTVVLTVNFILTIAIGAGLALLNVEGMGPESSFLYGSILGATGLMFGGLSMLFAQLSETSRGTTMFSFGILIVAYLIRAIGDVSNETISFISPLGWSVRTNVFIEDHWWPVVVNLITAIAIILIALYLQAIRDLGSGLIPARKGRYDATRILQTPLGFAWRLTRTNIISWGIGIFLLGASFGAILGDLETYYGDMELIQEFLKDAPGYTMTEQFVALLLAIMSLFSVVPAVMTVLKLKGEETKNRTEILYSRALSRGKMLGSYAALSIAVTVLMQILLVIGLWSASLSVMEEPLSFSTTLESALVYLPAMWAVVGLAILLLGLVPKVASFVWLYVVFCFVVLYLGGILDFPDWVNQLSVFFHIPQIPVEDMDVPSLAVLSGLAVCIVVIGFIGYRKRDLAG